MDLVYWPTHALIRGYVAMPAAASIIDLFNQLNDLASVSQQKAQQNAEPRVAQKAEQEAAPTFVLGGIDRPALSLQGMIDQLHYCRDFFNQHGITFNTKQCTHELNVDVQNAFKIPYKEYKIHTRDSTGFSKR